MNVAFPDHGGKRDLPIFPAYWNVKSGWPPDHWGTVKFFHVETFALPEGDLRVHTACGGSCESSRQPKIVVASPYLRPINGCWTWWHIAAPHEIRDII